MPPDTETLSLRECAQRLGVHYMTVYRYVRTGILPAVKEGAEWRVTVGDLESLGTRPAAPPARGEANWSDRLKARMIAGDERGSWLVVEASMASGLAPERVYLEVLAPALREIGEAWCRGDGTVAEEHRASAVAHRLVGRLGARFAARGRPRGRVVLGAPPGERHRLPISMVADILRAAGFDVADLGSDVPISSFVEAVRDTSPVAVGVSVTGSGALESAAAVASAIRAVSDVPILFGGLAVEDAGHAARLGGDGYAADGAAAAAWITDLIR